MATIDEELAGMERDIRQLKIEYDMFFGAGASGLPPKSNGARPDGPPLQRTRGRPEVRPALPVQQSFADLRKVQGHLPQETRVTRRRQGPAPFWCCGKSDSGRARAQAGTAQGIRRRIGHAAAKAFRMVCSEPEKESQKVDQLYEAFLQAKQSAGEETAKLTRSGFNEFVRKKTRDLQAEKHCRDVEYVVETVNGAVKLKALVKT